MHSRTIIYLETLLKEYADTSGPLSERSAFSVICSQVLLVKYRTISCLITTCKASRIILLKSIGFVMFCFIYSIPRDF